MRGDHATSMCPTMRKRRNKERHYVFFTLNGKFLGASFCCHGLDSVLPFVAFQDYVLPVQINFGKQPFMFDLSTLSEDDLIEKCKISSAERIPDEGPEDSDGDSMFSDDDDGDDTDSDRTDHTPDYDTDYDTEHDPYEDDEDDDREEWLCECGDSTCENSRSARMIARGIVSHGMEEVFCSICDMFHEDGQHWCKKCEDLHCTESRDWCEDCEVFHQCQECDDDDDDDGNISHIQRVVSHVQRVVDDEGNEISIDDFGAMMRMALAVSLREATSQNQNEETDERMNGIPRPREGETVRFRSKPTS